VGSAAVELFVAAALEQVCRRKQILQTKSEHVTPAPPARVSTRREAMVFVEPRRNLNVVKEHL